MDERENIEIEHVIDDIEDHINQEYDGVEYDKVEDIGPMAGISFGIIAAGLISKLLDANYSRMGAITMTTPSEFQSYAHGLDLITVKILPKGALSPEMMGAIELFGTGYAAHKARQAEAAALRSKEKPVEEPDAKEAA